eukprot:Em0572g1a
MGSSQPAMFVNAVQALWKQHAPQLDVRLVVLPMSQTLDSVTCGPSSPLILNTTSSFMSLQWNAPLQPDYVITAYTLHHRVPSLSPSQRCGHLLQRPQSSSIPTTPSGILFYQINSVMTDFLGGEASWRGAMLIFLDQLSLDPTVPEPSTMGYVVLFKLASNTFYITMDTVHAAAITATIVPLLTMKVYFEGFPQHVEQIWHCNPLQHVSYPLLNAPDGFDAVWVQNVGSTYMIVSWDLPTDSPPVTPAGTALQLEWASSVLQPACPGSAEQDALSMKESLDTVLPKAPPIMGVVAND